MLVLIFDQDLILNEHITGFFNKFNLNLTLDERRNRFY